MSKLLLIDGAHRQETRVAILDNGRVEDFDYEVAGSEQLRGNIYLAKVARVEPSLQAAFVDYGGNRHGFLAFDQIHPDYYNLTKEDRDKLLEEAAAEAALQDPESDDDEDDYSDGELEGAEKSIPIERITISLDEAEDGAIITQKTEQRRPSRQPMHKRYKIQDVIKRRQILLVQVVKEERGNKGAAVSSYLSLAGRYSVLMPNTPRGGGISRKISNTSDRKRLREIVGSLDIPKGMGLIVRTAGAKKSKVDIVRDYDYLTQTWDRLRNKTLKSIAPALVHQEGSLTFRAIRDMFDKSMERVFVAGEEAYQTALELAELVMPGQTDKIFHWDDPTPLFYSKGVESQLESVYSPTVELPSGGYLVINQTEALVAIDVNSGKSTKQKSIEDTALSTNLEAAAEACRQMRLRDLAGLVVIDFIDMEESKNNRAVEKRVADCLNKDRARIQNSRISQFGLMEISRQRRRAGVLHTASVPCSHCEGTGRIRSASMSAIQLLRALDRAAPPESGANLEIHAPIDTLSYLINNSRDALSDIEYRANGNFDLLPDVSLAPGKFRIETIGGKTETFTREQQHRHKRADTGYPTKTETNDTQTSDAALNDATPNRRRRRRKEKDPVPDTKIETQDSVPNIENQEESPSRDTEDPQKKRRRRRRKRERPVIFDVKVDTSDLEYPESTDPTQNTSIPDTDAETQTQPTITDTEFEYESEAKASPKPKPKKTKAKPKGDKTVKETVIEEPKADTSIESSNNEPVEENVKAEEKPKTDHPKRSGWWAS